MFVFMSVYNSLCTILGCNLYRSVVCMNVSGAFCKLELNYSDSSLCLCALVNLEHYQNNNCISTSAGWMGNPLSYKMILNLYEYNHFWD